ncbi:MAG: Bifunctional protein HldE, partial [Candidatus Anoxychlamydiales bacterium]|nr:Bifunctional protein HldE [Candidatus Anoxychlamydiales bacterium]
MYNKIKSLEEIGKVLKKHKKKGEKVVHCHGVFDLLHPGHIRHFKEAKKKGDKLVVSITPDKFVNKGPGRPAFNEKLRLESIAALSSVDYVVMNNSKDAINAIRSIKPDFYVKGKEYKDAKKDITGKIIDEEREVRTNGGQIYFTDDIVFSSSSLINKYVEPISEEAKSFIEKLKVRYSVEQIVEKIKKISSLKVLIIGDAIIDEYQYVDLLGQSAKGQHLVAS